MRFSLIYEAQVVEVSRESDHRVFRQILEQVDLAEELGFDVVWAVEHTALNQYAHMSAPETFLAFVAGRTQRIGIGHGVVCLPPMMNHPVKVAERIATLDLLSGGRVHFGIGKGGTQQEAGTFGYQKADAAEMVDEMMYLVPRIMAEDSVAHDGKWVQFEERSIHPKPMQDPHPPMYLACTGDESLTIAGSRGIGALAFGFGGLDQVARKNRIYRDAWNGRDPADQVGFVPTEHFAALCPVIIDENREKARRVGLRGQRFFIESLNQWAAGTPAPDVDSWGDDLTSVSDDGKMVVTIGSENIEVDFSTPSGALFNPHNAYGTVDDAIHYVQALIDAGADEVLFMTQMGTVPQDIQLQTLRALGEHVIPHFRCQGARVGLDAAVA
jgi:alkanesulfonate monooxygenase SsuD/methylene tetrahydromethanopterin reductase-like flavin-dependent oxidoreductase (luciferase family)